MMPLTVDAMLAATGTSLRAQSGPADLRPILTAAVLACTPASALAKFLEGAGRPVPERTLIQWLKSTRAWLGLPQINRGRAGEEYRQMLDRWHKVNGFPSAQEIEEGWIPLHQRPAASRAHQPILHPAPRASENYITAPATDSHPAPHKAVDKDDHAAPNASSLAPELEDASTRPGRMPEKSENSRKPDPAESQRLSCKQARLQEIAAEIDALPFDDEEAWTERVIKLQTEEFFLLNEEEATAVDVADLRRGLPNFLADQRKKVKKRASAK